MTEQERKKENRNYCPRFERIVKRIRRYSHISSMVSLRQWSGTELRAWHLQRFPETRRISLLLWISSETGSPAHSLASFFSIHARAHVHTYTPLYSCFPLRVNFISNFIKKRRATRLETNRCTFLFFFYLEKRIVKNTEFEIWLNTLLLLVFSSKSIYD